MGKKKGGSKNKLARMSEEERARYLQHRADMEEEARRRKQQLIALYMKNKLKREEAFTRLNLAKINQEWRTILRQVKCQSLKREIIDFEKLFEDAFEQKNRIIQRLLNDLDEAEDMYSNLQQSHMESIDKIMAIQKQRKNYFKESYIDQRDAIISEVNEDFKEYKSQREKAYVSLEASYFTLEKSGEDHLRLMHEHYLKKLDDIKSEMSIKLEDITRSREEQIEHLWSEHRRVLNEYVAYMDSFYAEYSDLREKDEANTIKIRNYCSEVAKLTNQLTDLKIDADNTVEEGESQVTYLQNHRDELNTKYLVMKKKLDTTLRADQDNFRFLGVCGHESLQDLQQYYRKGEQILQLAAVCRRMESEREKIMPFDYSKGYAFEKTEEEMREPPDEFKNALDNWYSMEMFWERVNRVKIDNACLREEKYYLESSNASLKTQLKDYLTAVTIASGPNGNIHDRMSSRPSSMKVEKVVRINLEAVKKPGSSPAVRGQHPHPKKMSIKIKRRPYTCVEANLSNAVRSQSLVAKKLTTAKLDAIVW